MILAVVSLVIFLAYLVGMYIYFGIPASLSDTYYKLENRHKGAGWFFTAMCWGVSLPLIPYLLDVTPAGYQFTAFLACAGLMFVGAAPQFKLSLTGPVHYVSAALCCSAAVLWCVLSGYWFVPLATFLAAGLLTLRYGKPMFWIEIAAFAATYLTIFLAQ